jgi:predicted nucleic acid-binding protein
MRLVDSNILIYLTAPEHGELSARVLAEPVFVSIVTVVEVLGYHRLTRQEEADLRSILEQFTVLPLDGAVANQAIILRQQRKIGLGDAVIAATALVHNLPVVTRNTADFQNVAGLNVLDPFSA